ncbi:MAG: winged helix-turn-helix transcriptional regulator [Candidatus Hydrogenedentes bacterium]|nr:winged helix-turn-helix transcriptional regulator [Candidatus Hydrogenedentota bacterium]
MTKERVVDTIIVQEAMMNSVEIARRCSKECIGARVRKLHRAVSKVYEDAFRPYAVSLSQMNVIMMVAARGGCDQVSIATSLDMDVSTLSRVVRGLRDKGLVGIGPGCDDRTHEVFLTESGSALVEETFELWKQSQERVRALIGDELSDMLIQHVPISQPVGSR